MNVRYLVVVALLAVEIFLLGLVFQGRRTDRRLQHETDIRLTYKRYKELYPSTTLSYKQYKKLQTERAYKKSISSRKIKRMVR